MSGTRHHHIVEILIPAGQTGRPCKLGCGTTVFLALHPSTGKPHPVSCNGNLVFDAKPPQRHRPGRGASHFMDCSVYLREQEILRERRERDRRVLREQQPELGL